MKFSWFILLHFFSQSSCTKLRDRSEFIPPTRHERYGKFGASHIELRCIRVGVKRARKMLDDNFGRKVGGSDVEVEGVNVQHAYERGWGISRRRSQRSQWGGNGPKVSHGLANVTCWRLTYVGFEGEMETALLQNIQYVYDDAIPLVIWHHMASRLQVRFLCPSDHNIPLPLWLVFVRHNFMNVGGDVYGLPELGLSMVTEWVWFTLFFFMVCGLIHTIFSRVKLRSLYMRNFYTGGRVNDFIFPE